MACARYIVVRDRVRMENRSPVDLLQVRSTLVDEAENRNVRAIKKAGKLTAKSARAMDPRASAEVSDRRGIRIRDRMAQIGKGADRR